MAKVNPEKFIWLDGGLQPWSESLVHLLTHSLHYGLAAFEGIRAYRQQDGSGAVFRLGEHIDRLFDSCHICTIEVPRPRSEISAACVELLRENGMAEGYLRPLVFLGDGSMGLGALDPPVRVGIAAYVWGTYLGEEGLRRGIRAKVSSFTRSQQSCGLAKGKIAGQYFTSVLAKREVVRAGYDEAIMLDAQGYVAEASGENIFMVSRGQLITPPLSAAILAGITRESVLTLARDLGIPTVEAMLSRDQLYLADEVFLTGTAAELTPVREIDDRRIGSGQPGPLTQRLQAAFFDAARGKNPRYSSWLTPIR
jgi:branched-chain amino acid aminotransferase